MPPFRVLRVLASVRVPSGHGADVEYEIVQAIVSDDPDLTVTHESVFVRLVMGDRPVDDRVADILVADLPAVQAQWGRFVQDVLWRRAQAGDHESQLALEQLAPSAPASAKPEVPVISASGGRFGQGTGEVPYIPAKKEKKRTTLNQYTAVPSVPAPSARPSLPAIEEQPMPSIASAPPRTYEYDVIGFNLSTPPTADGLMRPIRESGEHLLVVAPITLVPKVEEFIGNLKSGAVRGRPTTFNPIVIRRTGEGPVATNKLHAEVAGGIVRMLGDLNSALWIVPSQG